MSGPVIDVIKPGAQSQLQDLGRWSHQHLGVPVGGAMDEVSHRLANLLVGNPGDEATLEIVLMGPSLRFGAPAQFALCGADYAPTLDGTPLPLNRRIDAKPGAVLAFGQRINGLRCYLALRGGFAVAPVLGSRSTLVRAGFGGHAGRALRKGDALPMPALPPAPPLAARLLQGVDALATRMPATGADDVTTVRVVHGEHWGLFTPEAQAQFSAGRYRASPQSDRMGYRFEGPALQRAVAGDLISEAISFGTIQVPPDGQPIVLMAERQSTGGYPKIAHVASIDLPLVAQLAPQQWLHFEPVLLATAQALYLQRERAFAALAALK